jgi:hypothetical protein
MPANSTNIENGTCKMFKMLSLVTGDLIDLKAKEARACEKKCGYEAKEFEHHEYNLIYE